MSDQPKCSLCGETERSKFSTRIVNGTRYLRTCCKKCENTKRVLRRQREGFSKSPARQKYGRKLSLMRRTNVDVSRFILEDSKNSDKKRGHRNDLDKAFICELIKNGCSYCGEIKLRMTLDRVDNAKGHTKKNVVPACVRCNYTRGNMPHEAWLCLIDGMKRARLDGLFGDWTGRLNRKS